MAIGFGISGSEASVLTHSSLVGLILFHEDLPSLLQKSVTRTLRLKIAQKPYIVWSLGPKAFRYQSLEPKGKEVEALRLWAGSLDP